MNPGVDTAEVIDYDSVANMYELDFVVTFYTRNGSSRTTWVDEAWVDVLYSAPPAPTVVITQKQIEDLVKVETKKDDRQFDGFCDACSGFRKHRLMCPVGSYR